MRAVVLGSNAVLVLNVVQSLGSLGIQSDVVSDWYLPRVRFSRSCRRYVRVPFGTLSAPSEQTWQWLERYCFAHDIDVVIAADLAMTFAAASPEGKRFDIPFFPVPDLLVLERLHDKWAFYRLLTQLGLPAPQTELLEPGSSTWQLNLAPPLIVKPPASEGGDGVARFDSLHALDAMRREANNAHKRWLVQRFIPGHDIDLSVLGADGEIVAYTIQMDVAPGIKRFVMDERVLAAGRSIVRATKLNGLAHFDMRIDERDGSLYVIECNPRVWGSLQYSTWAGVNFIEFGCRLLLGRMLPEFTPAHGEVRHEGVAPRRLFKALMRGRTAPQGMTAATLASWRQAHRDPIPQLIGELTEGIEEAQRRARPQPPPPPELQRVSLPAPVSNDNAAATQEPLLQALRAAGAGQRRS